MPHQQQLFGDGEQITEIITQFLNYLASGCADNCEIKLDLQIIKIEKREFLPE